MLVTLMWQKDELDGIVYEAQFALGAVWVTTDAFAACGGEKNTVNRCPWRDSGDYQKLQIECKILKTDA